MNSNQKKEVQLGMPFGTANGRLKHMLMFELVKELNRNTCFRCGQEICAWQELSIEHKIPWLDSDPNLFWNMKNISFSHHRCNCLSIRHEYRVINGKRTAETLRQKYGIRSKALPGTAWCSKHREYLPINQFHKNVTESAGLMKMCIECNRNRRRAARTRARSLICAPVLSDADLAAFKEYVATFSPEGKIKDTQV